MDIRVITMIFNTLPPMGNETSVTPKKRYTTPLHHDELKRCDTRRKRELSAKVRRPESQQDDRFPPSELDHWLSANSDYNHKRISVHSMASSAAMWEDAWSAYEALHGRDTKQHCRFDLDQPSYNEYSANLDRPIYRGTIEHPCRRSESTKSCNRGEIRCAHRAKRATLVSDVRRPHSSQAILSSTEDYPFRGYSPSPNHPLLPNGQLYHPQLHERRPNSVPNYSRPWTPDIVRARKCAPSRRSRAASPMVFKPPIIYERVNGVYFDPKPRITKEIWEGLSIPKIETQDAAKIDRWLHKHNGVDSEFTSSVSHPARSPPPIGGKEDSVRSISPQPPSLGKNHTFVSRYSWTTEKFLTKSEKLLADEMLDLSDEDPAPSPSISTGPTSEAQNTEKVGRSDSAFTLLTEIIKGLFGSTRGPSRFNNEASYCGYKDSRQMRGYRHQASNARSLPFNSSTKGYGRKATHSQYNTHTSPSKRAHYSSQGSCRRQLSLKGRNVIRFITMRPSKIAEEV